MDLFSVNKKALFNYEILEKIVAGIELQGHEAKSVKLGRFDLSGSHAIIRGNEAYLVGATIHPFQVKNAPSGYDATRTRKLLLNKEEIHHLAGKLNEGLTIVPLKSYNIRGFVKIELGLGRGKKKSDKRETIKKRETEREIRRNI
ncbi:MAG: SsrA-binding protein SmpB [Candidatus Paceibacterota bacterium]|jgi:SsrA-binding protein